MLLPWSPLINYFLPYINGLQVTAVFLTLNQSTITVSVKITRYGSACILINRFVPVSPLQGKMDGRMNGGQMTLHFRLNKMNVEVY